MIGSTLSRLLLAATVGASALVSPFVAAQPAAAGCAHDPYNGQCVRTVSYRLRGHGNLYLQRSPRMHNSLRKVSRRARVRVICQVNNGGNIPGKRNHTWNALVGGGWVSSADIRMPLGRNGYTPGVRHCGAGGRPHSAALSARSSGSDAPTTTGVNPADYPWPAQDGWTGDGHGYYQGECVSFAAWAVRTDNLPDVKSTDWLGNADNWSGAYVDSSPHAGDVAQWDGGRNGAGSVGHVAYVAAVNSDGSVVVWEYNWGTFHRFHARTISADTPSRYLHF